MATIIGNVCSSHVPAIGGAIAKGLQQDPYWKPFFDGFPPVREWIAQARPDVAVVFYNDHGLNFFLDKMPTFAVGAAPEYRNADEGWGIPEVPPFAGDLDLSWHLIESLVAECHRIMVRGGIFLYPGDRRPEHQTGRLRLAFECNPLALLVEQAGGAATTGHENILDIEPVDIHQRVPLIFGSVHEVRLLEHYYREAHPYQERSQLFGNRGLFRSS